MSLTPGAQLGPYVVVSRLGAGGMGEVWLAEDPRLGRRVALKHPAASALTSAGARTRIETEARAAARLNHPGIAGVYDVLDHEGQLHIVMEYVEGRTLAALLRSGPFSIEQAVDIGVQLADALAAAHAADVVHRDLKPSNIVLTPGGRIKVLDFGIARIGGTLTLDHGTSQRVIFGTPGYSPPEQLLGGPAHPRGDIYSAGAVLYELLTARSPLAPENTSTDAPAALSAALPPVQALNPAVPDALAAIVERTLAPDPADRYASAASLRAELKRLASALRESPTTEILPDAPTGPIERVRAPRDAWRPDGRWIGALIALALAAGVGMFTFLRDPSSVDERAAATQVPIVAVLPLENLSGDPSNEYIGAGMAETLTMAVSKLNTVSVLSRAEVLQALRRTREPRQLAADLGAAYLVDGSVQESADQLLVTLRLVAPDGQVAWSEPYEGTTALVFDLHRRMATAVVEQLRRTHGGPVTAPAPVPTKHVEALTTYWKGRSLLEQATTVEQVSEAIASFSRAVDLDSEFALGHAGLADAFWTHYQLSRDGTMPRRALQAGLKALDLDPNQPDVRVAVANIYMGVGQYEDALRQVDDALARQPAHDGAYRVRARILLGQGEGENAIAALRNAIQVRPNYWRNHYELGGVYNRLRRLPAAADAYHRALQLRPKDVRIYDNLGIVYARMWENERALGYFELANELQPSQRNWSNVGQLRYWLGRYDEAIAAYREALRLDPNSAITHGNLGDAYERLGRSQEAQRGYRAARELSLDALKVNERDALTLAALATYEAKLGMHEQADTHAAQAVALTPDDPDVLYKRAVVDALAGRTDAALDALTRAVARGDVARQAREDADLAALRQRSEFQAIVAQPR